MQPRILAAPGVLMLAATLSSPAIAQGVAQWTPVKPGSDNIEVLAACSAAAVGPGAPYYAIELVPTGRVPGTRRARGEAHVTFARSPFGLAVNSDGQYVYDLRVEFSGLSARDGNYVVWLAMADLSEVRAVGRLDDSSTPGGRVDWNKFLVVVTLEAPDAPLGAMWAGPIVARGMSRSGRMHTMAGHGPFQAEPCAKYGY